MKTSHTIFSILILTLSFPSVSVSKEEGRRRRGPGRPMAPPEMMLKCLFEKSPPTRGQIEKLKSIRVDRQVVRAEIEKLRNLRLELDQVLSQDSKEENAREKFEGVLAQERSLAEFHFNQFLKVRAILSPEQRALISGCKQELRKNARRSGRGGRGGPGGPGMGPGFGPGGPPEPGQNEEMDFKGEERSN